MNSSATHQLVPWLGLALIVAVGCATPGLPPVEAAPCQQATEEPQAVQPQGSSYAQAACEALARTGGAQFQSEAPTLEDRFPKLIELITEVDRCREAGHVSAETLSGLLSLARQRFVEWYEIDARRASAILLGDLTLDGDSPRRARQSWAAIYLAIIDQLALLGVPTEQGVELSERMLRVDAQAARVLERLKQPVTGESPALSLQRTEAALVALRDSLVAEAESWAARPSADSWLTGAGLTMPRSMPPRMWSLEDRIQRVSSLVYWIAMSWGAHPLDLHRGTLGVGYQAYLESFRRTEATFPFEKRLRVVWPMFVHTPSVVERSTEKRVDEVLQDIVYDGLNLRGYFAMRGAQSTWLSVLPPGGGNQDGGRPPAPVTDERLRQAENALVQAWEATTSRDVRLRNVAALINRTDLVFIQPVKLEGTPIQGGDPRLKPGARLAELGLCLMNHALFKGEHPPCTLDPIPGGESQPASSPLQPALPLRCSEGGELAEAFVEGVPPEALEAYRRVLGALALERRAFAEHTRCEVLALLRRTPLESLRADAPLLRAAMDLVYARKVELGPQQLGELLVTAIQRLQVDGTAPCVRLGLGANCSVDEIRRRNGQEQDESHKVWTERWGKLFCTAMKTGEWVFKVADGSQERPQDSYIGYISPLTPSELADYRSKFKDASNACRGIPWGVEDLSPDVAGVSSARGGAKPTAAQQRIARGSSPQQGRPQGAGTPPGRRTAQGAAGTTR